MNLCVNLNLADLRKYFVLFDNIHENKKADPKLKTFMTYKKFNTPTDNQGSSGIRQ